jgi:hypothetical protein
MVVEAETDYQEHRITELEAENEQLKTQLSRGVFVRELSDGELLDAYRDCMAQWCVLAEDPEPNGIRACIAEATKLPDGAQRFTQPISVAGVLGYESADGAESLQLALPDGPGVFHIVFVPEVTNG